MKQSLSRLRLSKLSSFTLVELLVVIAIIAILASVILYAGGMVLKSAQRAKAANTAVEIQTAALGYYTEYGVYPVPGGTTTDYTLADSGTQTAWGNLICSLCGNIKPYTGGAYTAVAATPTNSRGIAFITFRTTEVDSGNAPLNPFPPDTTTHIYFNIAMDSDYDGVLGTTSPTSTVMPNFAAGTSSSLTLSGGTSTAGVAVWANCTGKPNSTSCNANWWVHTY